MVDFLADLRRTLAIVPWSFVLNGGGELGLRVISVHATYILEIGIGCTRGDFVWCQVEIPGIVRFCLRMIKVHERYVFVIGDYYNNIIITELERNFKRGVLGSGVIG